MITKVACPWCVKLKDQLKLDGVSFEEIDRKDVEDFPFATVPQLWIDGEHIGGYSEYMEAKHASTTEDYAECEACSG